jgi:hypothetical protein
MNIEVTWWGKLQWYKFRWYKDHIDLGVISFYNLPQQGIGYLFWRLVSILIKPLRWWYHRRFIYRTKAQIRNIEWEMNFYNKEVNG